MAPNLPVGGSTLDVELGASGALPEDVTQFAATMGYTLADRVLEGDEDAPPSFDLDDDAKLETARMTLFARHHFGHGWAADFTLPVGMVVLTSSAGEHRRLSGLGDLELGGRYDFSALWGAGGYSPSSSGRPS